MVWGYFTHCAATIKCTSALNANMQLSMGALNTSAQEMEAEQWDRLQGWLNDSKLIHSDWCHFPLCAATIKCTRALKCQTCNTSQPRKRAPSARTAQWTTFFLFLKNIQSEHSASLCSLDWKFAMCTFQEKGKAMHCYETACDMFMGSANPAWRHSMHLYKGWEQRSEIVKKDKNNAVKSKNEMQ